VGSQIAVFLCSLSTLPVRRLLCSIAANRHAAPPLHMASGSIDEEKRAARQDSNLQPDRYERRDNGRFR
jgi:hypothetical protein